MTGHVVLRHLWLGSLCVRALAVAIGWKRSQRYWTAWALFYLLSGIILRIDDIVDPKIYVPIWECQQVFSLALLVLVVREAIKPAWLLCYAAAGVSLAVAAATAQAHHWPDSLVESVMWAGGTAALALGIVSTAGRKVYSAILAAFLLLYAGLMLAGADYLTSANLGIAWDVLEIAAFSAWGISFMIRKHSEHFMV